ncbi:MAG: CotH kinase family protein [Bacteroidota bacterium]
MKHLYPLFLFFLFCSPLSLPAQTEPNPLRINCSKPGGFYATPIEVSLFSREDATIYYTLDGSTPSKKKKRYTSPIRIQQSSVIRAIAVTKTQESTFFGETYFIDEPESTFPVVSIGIDPWRLFDPDYGLFMEGNYAVDSIWSKPGANFWSRKEYPMHCEIYEVDGSCVFNSEAGFRIFGGFSRLFPQKSMTIVARDRYGKKKIDHPIFGEDGEDKFKFIVLRNSGSDFGKTHFRDGLMTGLVDDWDIEKQDFRSAHVYINGDYWGIYNMREKVNRHFLKHYHDQDKDSINLMEHQQIVKLGNSHHYEDMLYFLRRNPLSVDDNMAYLNTQMEIENFMDYQIAQIYFDNQDAGGNIKYWRPQTPNGRWRWILFDTDWGFGLNDPNAFQNNSLDFHTTPDGPSWPNPPWTTFMLRKLLENQEFEHAFINRFADHLNMSFEEKTVEEKIDELYVSMQPEIDRQLVRWNIKRKDWERHVRRLYAFAEERPTLVRMHLMDKFDTGAQKGVQLQSTSGGSILLNDHLSVASFFQGIYFEYIPISVAAIPNYGYRFSHWEGLPMRYQENEQIPTKLTLPLDLQTVDLKAVFEPYEHPVSGQLVINEISANNKVSGDWLELYNRTKEPIVLTDWILTDQKNEFRLPSVVIQPRDYLVICEDSTKFFKTFPKSYNIVSGLPFGINKHRERIQLFDPQGAIVDSLQYELPPRDSTYTLSLLLPHLNNADIENWRLQKGNGTPNAGNPYYIESNIRREQELWLRMGMAASTILLSLLLLFVRNRWKKQQATYYN